MTLFLQSFTRISSSDINGPRVRYGNMQPSGVTLQVPLTLGNLIDNDNLLWYPIINRLEKVGGIGEK